MDSSIIQVLNDMGPGAQFGTITAAILAMVFAIYKFILWCVSLYKANKEKIKKEVHEEDEEDSFKELINKLDNSVSILQTNVTNMSKKQDEEFTNFRNQLSSIKDEIRIQKENYERGDVQLEEQINNNEKVNREISRKLEIINNNQTKILESNIESMRAEITNIYYEYAEKGFIPIYILQSVESIYEKYLNIGGNTFVSSIVTEMRKWNHVDSHKDNKEENE